MKDKDFIIKKSITHKLIIPIAFMVSFAIALLFLGAYHSVSYIVKEENKRYSKSIVSIFSDVVLLEAEARGVPVKELDREWLKTCSDYICEWYRVDYMYVCIPDTQTKSVDYLTISWKKDKFGEDVDLLKIQRNELTKEELEVWENSEQTFAVLNNDYLEKTLDTVTKVTDSNGNKTMCCVAISLADVNAEIRKSFITVAVVITAVFVILVVLLFLLVKKSVSNPAKKICEGIADFIKDGKRLNVKLDVNGNDEFAMISKTFNKMTDDIDVYLNNIGELNREQERQKTELDIASKIQQGFLPANFYNSGDCEIRAVMNPAKDVGGDLYDYFRTYNENTLIVIGDISGKGVPSAMFMAVTLMLIRQFAKTDDSPAKILKNVNSILTEYNPKMIFATAFIGIYNDKTKILTYSNAGHNLPYIINKDGVSELTGANNTLLGIFDGEEYTEEKVELNIGDVLFAYTDGVNEAVNPDKEFFGIKRLKEVLVKAEKEHEENYVDRVEKTLEQFVESAERHDDVTMLTLTVKESKNLSLKVDVKEFEKIKEVILGSALKRELQLNLCVAAEECFVNICSYAYEEKNKDDEMINFVLECSDRVVMKFIDGGNPYDPRETVANADDYDIDEQIGGLGKLIAFTVADSVDYEYKDGKNILTLKKYIKEKNNDDKQN